MVSPIFMPKNQLKKDEFRIRILKLKSEVYNESKNYWEGDKRLAHKYLNKVLDIIDEYRY